MPYNGYADQVEEWKEYEGYIAALGEEFWRVQTEDVRRQRKAMGVVSVTCNGCGQAMVRERTMARVATEGKPEVLIVLYACHDCRLLISVEEVIYETVSGAVSGD